MAKLYLRITTAVGKEQTVRNALRRTAGVRSADLVTGRYDVIAVVQGASLEAAIKTVLSGVRGITGIEKTETDIVIE